MRDMRDGGAGAGASAGAGARGSAFS